MQTATNTIQSPRMIEVSVLLSTNPGVVRIPPKTSTADPLVDCTVSSTDPKIKALDLQGSEFLSSHRQPTFLLFSTADPLVDCIVEVSVIADQ